MTARHDAPIVLDTNRLRDPAPRRFFSALAEEHGGDIRVLPTVESEVGHQVAESEAEQYRKYMAGASDVSNRTFARVTKAVMNATSEWWSRLLDRGGLYVRQPMD